MEEERFVSGYCRQMDGSRMVEVVLTDGKVSEADCNFGSCPYEGACPIGQKIAELGKD